MLLPISPPDVDKNVWLVDNPEPGHHIPAMKWGTILKGQDLIQD